MLKIAELTKVYKSAGSGACRAVDKVSFAIEPGEVVSLIGESGSGKTTIGKMVLKLSPSTEGKIEFLGKNIESITSRAEMKDYYRNVQGVFQDPFSTFNPIFKADRVFRLVKDQFFPGLGMREWQRKINDVLTSVGLNPSDVLGKYSYQLSGGQLQRVLIARALLLDVKLLVADEIISMLDASTRIDVLNLLGMLAESRGLSVLFITHDLSLGYYISQKTVILYKGFMVESGDTRKVYARPVHPYTRKLLAAVPRLDQKWADHENPPGIYVPVPLFNPDSSTGHGKQYEAEPQHWVAVEQE